MRNKHCSIYVHKIVQYILVECGGVLRALWKLKLDIKVSILVMRLWVKAVSVAQQTLDMLWLGSLVNTAFAPRIFSGGRNKAP